MQRTLLKKSEKVWKVVFPQSFKFCFFSSAALFVSNLLGLKELELERVVEAKDALNDVH